MHFVLRVPLCFRAFESRVTDIEPDAELQSTLDKLGVASLTIKEVTNSSVRLFPFYFLSLVQKGQLASCCLQKQENFPPQKGVLWGGVHSLMQSSVLEVVLLACVSYMSLYSDIPLSLQAQNLHVSNTSVCALTTCVSFPHPFPVTYSWSSWYLGWR